MNSKPHHIAVIGPRELVSGLSAIGIIVFEATNATEALEALTRIRSDKRMFASVCITESIMRTIPQDALYQKDTPLLPVILTIPDLASDKNAGLEKLRELTKRAIGSDILAE